VYSSRGRWVRNNRKDDDDFEYLRNWLTMSSRSLVGSFILLLSLLLLRRIRAETEVYLAPRLKWKRHFFSQFQLIASASPSKCASIFFLKMMGLDAFTISSLRPFQSLKTQFGRKWLLTRLEFLYFQFKSMAAQMGVCAEFK
jgi:hypothetical protein